MTCLVDMGQAADIVYLDFSKAFDTVPHSLLLEELMCYGLDKWSVQWCGLSANSPPTAQNTV